MDEIVNKRSKLWVVVVLVLLVVGLLYLFQKSQDSKKCEDRAIAAAVDTYPIAQYPNTAERSVLQEAYTKRYMESCN